MYEEKFMLRALELAREADKLDEVPVGAVIVKRGEIIAEGINRKERDLVATHHAEMVAIEEAAKKLNNWWLEDCELYVTLEPCPMCAMAMQLSRIKAVYFGAYINHLLGVCLRHGDIRRLHRRPCGGVLCNVTIF